MFFPSFKDFANSVNVKFFHHFQEIGLGGQIQKQRDIPELSLRSKMEPFDKITASGYFCKKLCLRYLTGL